MKEAMFWEGSQENSVICSLCSHHCRIEEGKRGICDVRENKDGRLYSLVYGKAASLVPDPIEKKPLYHFHPGTSVLSFGTMGCNFRCLFCQNASISRGDPESKLLDELTVNRIVDEAMRYDGVAWTYNEPTMSFEYSYDVFREYKGRGGGYTVYVTNGYMEKEPLKKIAPYLDAMNIDIKAFNDDFYKDIVGARLEPVLRSAIMASKLDIHIEITYLMIPDHNDNVNELKDFSSWVKEALGEDTPVHFSRFHPDHRMLDTPSTPRKTMEKARKIARNEGLNFVYIGNLPADNDTRCPNCGKIIISRSYFSTGELSIKDGQCIYCSRNIPVIR